MALILALLEFYAYYTSSKMLRPRPAAIAFGLMIFTHVLFVTLLVLAMQRFGLIADTAPMDPQAMKWLGIVFGSLLALLIPVSAMFLVFAQSGAAFSLSTRSINRRRAAAMTVAWSGAVALIVLAAQAEAIGAQGIDIATTVVGGAGVLLYFYIAWETEDLSYAIMYAKQERDWIEYKQRPQPSQQPATITQAELNSRNAYSEMQAAQTLRAIEEGRLIVVP